MRPWGVPAIRGQQPDVLRCSHTRFITAASSLTLRSTTEDSEEAREGKRERGRPHWSTFNTYRKTTQFYILLVMAYENLMCKIKTAPHNYTSTTRAYCYCINKCLQLNKVYKLFIIFRPSVNKKQILSLHLIQLSAAVLLSQNYIYLHISSNLHKFLHKNCCCLSVIRISAAYLARRLLSIMYKHSPLDS